MEIQAAKRDLNAPPTDDLNIWLCGLGVMGVRVGVAYLRNKPALRIRLQNLNLKSQFSIFDSIRVIRCYIYDFF